MDETTNTAPGRSRRVARGRSVRDESAPRCKAPWRLAAASLMLAVSCSAGCGRDVGGADQGGASNANAPIANAPIVNAPIVNAPIASSDGPGAAAPTEAASAEAAEDVRRRELARALLSEPAENKPAENKPGKNGLGAKAAPPRPRIPAVPTRQVAAPGSPTGAPQPPPLADAPAKPRSGVWPNWMGPAHDGISHERGWSKRWPATGLPRKWSRQIGIGFSSVSLSEGRLYTMGHIDGREQVFCLNAETGEELWTHGYGAPLVDNLHEGGPGTTPTIDGRQVYTVSRGGKLNCYNAATGEVEWTRELTADLDVDLPEWGFTSSPYILGRQLILEAGRVVSYDKTSGEILWKTERHRAGYGSAVSFQSPIGTLLATLDCDGLRVVNADNGAEIDFAPWDSPFRTNSTTPIVRGDLIFVSSGYNVGCGLFQLVEGKLQKRYSNRDMRNHFNNSVLLGDHLYGFDGNSNLGRTVHLTCMHLATGEVAWKQRGLGCGSLMIADGNLLILSEDGKLVLAAASPDGYQELARAPLLDGRCWTVPVLLDGCVYARNAEGDLVCVSLRN